MIQSLYRIGKEISKDRDEWADFISTVKTSSKDESKNKLSFKLIFDIDNNEITIDRINLEDFDNGYTYHKNVKNINVLGGNNKSIYITAEEGKPALIAKTFFGKPDKNGTPPTKGEFLQALEKDFPDLLETTFAQVLENIFPLKTAFDDLFLNEKGVHKTDKLKERLELGKNDKLVLIYTAVKWGKLGEKPIDLGNVEGYKTFLKRKFIPEKKKTDTAKKESLCYATGEMRSDVKEAGFSSRYNINKLFVTTTQNYATGLNKKNYSKNYQISSEIGSFLDRGSEFILKNCTTTIADISHAIIPQFFNQENLEIEYLQAISKKTDLIFHLSTLEEFSGYMELYANYEDFNSLTFIAIDSNGNYFKIANQIRDVSKFHFEEIIATLQDANKYFRPWLGDKYVFNLGTMYYALPVRSDKEKTNRALHLFASILEQRQIEEDRIYKFFTELVLCHYYKRYRGYKNILENQNFDFAVKDAVFKYSAFIYSLRQLNLLKEKKMDDKSIVDSENEEKDFFSQMKYSKDEEALFYLGRMLNRVVYIQKDKKKTVLDKLNYNGMDKNSIYRLSNELFEKAKQYSETKKVLWFLGKFNKRFHPEHWNMSPQKALFFILAGYTYGIKSKTQAKIDSSTTQK